MRERLARDGGNMGKGLQEVGSIGEAMNEEQIIKLAMSALGKRTSEKKKASSRENGKRPKKPRKRTVSLRRAKSPKTS